MFSTMLKKAALGVWTRLSPQAQTRVLDVAAAVADAVQTAAQAAARAARYYFTVKWDPFNVGRRPFRVRVGGAPVDVVLLAAAAPRARRALRHFWSRAGDAPLDELARLARRLGLPDELVFTGVLMRPEGDPIDEDDVSTISTKLLEPHVQFTAKLKLQKKEVVYTHVLTNGVSHGCTHRNEFALSSIPFNDVFDKFVGKEPCKHLLNDDSVEEIDAITPISTTLLDKDT